MATRDELERERDRLLALLAALNDAESERDEALEERDEARDQLSELGPVIALALAYDRPATEYHLRKIGLLDSSTEIGFAHRVVWRFSV
jgi:hypothetical protein